MSLVESWLNAVAPNSPNGRRIIRPVYDVPAARGLRDEVGRIIAELGFCDDGHQPGERWPWTDRCERCWAPIEVEARHA